jgi:hypothetical protein
MKPAVRVSEAAAGAPEGATDLTPSAALRQR